MTQLVAQALLQRGTPESMSRRDEPGGDHSLARQGQLASTLCPQEQPRPHRGHRQHSRAVQYPGQ